MSALRAVGAIALADFRERTRRKGFLAAVAFVGWLAYLVASGRLDLWLDSYQGVMNAPWLGSTLALIVCTCLGYLGFFLVNRGIDLDRRSGVGELLAACPIGRAQYTLAKWLANCATLGLLSAVLLGASLLLQWRYLPQVAPDLPALLAPILVIAVPMIVVTAACAVLFESVGFLRGGLGNGLWLIGWPNVLFPLSHMLGGARHAWLDLTGFQLLMPSMTAAAKAAYPAYAGGFRLGPAQYSGAQLFPWAGVHWSMPILMQRSVWLVLAAVPVLLAALCFDRFDPAAARLGRQRPAADPPHGDAPQGPAHAAVPSTGPALSLLRFSPGYRLQTELLCLLKGARLWWWAVALGLAVAGLTAPAPARGMLLLASWVWPVTMWSQMGCREVRAGLDEMLFASPQPILLQLPAQWLAGFALVVLSGAGVLLRLLAAGDSQPLLAVLAGAVFIPSLALALGALSGTPQMFEIIYLLLCYAGPLEGVPALDFIGASGTSAPGVWLTAAAASLCAAFVWRWRQLQR